MHEDKRFLRIFEFFGRREVAGFYEDDALDGAARESLQRLIAANGLVFVTGWDPRARAALLYALAQTAAAPTKKIVTLERAVSYVVPEFVQVEVPGEFADGAATILTHPADVIVVEDLAASPTCIAI